MIICRCNEVSDFEIRKFMKKHPHASFEALKLVTSAGTSCGRCKPLLQKIHERFSNEQPQNNQLRLPF
ncbi:MAG: (2Fe-2S)-binding protein [Prolixibacteraceae bacterium]|nr:(2Fe-2S)-binding protein [Prolixibacteraceae bacterium]